jgi:hypothetical protein
VAAPNTKTPTIRPRRPFIARIASGNGGRVKCRGLGRARRRWQNLSVPSPPNVSLRTIVREWGRIGCVGFGGPPTHVALLRHLCIDERRWMSAQEFEDGVAAANVLPGPMSTQLAIFCAWRLRGPLGGLVGGLCFILPGLILILALASVILGPHPPAWIMGQPWVRVRRCRLWP